MSLQSVYEIRSEWLEALQLAGAIGVNGLVPVLIQLKLSTEERRLLTSPHSDCFYMKTISSHFLDLLKENGLLSFWWEFPLKGFLDETGRGWSRDAVKNNF